MAVIRRVLLVPLLMLLALAVAVWLARGVLDALAAGIISATSYLKSKL